MTKKRRSILLLLALTVVPPVAAQRPVQLKVDNQCLAGAATPTAIGLETCQVADSRNLWQVPDRGYFGAFLDGSGLCLATAGNSVVRAECAETIGQTWRHRSDGLVTSQLGQCLRESSGALALGACEDATRWVETALNGWSELGPDFGYLDRIDLYATPDSTVFYLTGPVDGLKRSSDAGLTWSSAAPFGVDSLAVDPTAADHLWAIGGPAGQEGLWQSRDSGQSWNSALLADLQQVVVNPLEPRTLVVRQGESLLRSQDDGATFTPLVPPWISGSVVTIEYVGGALFATAQGFCLLPIGCFGQNGLFKSLNDGATWQSLNLPPIGHSTLPRVAIDPTNTNRLYLETRPIPPPSPQPGMSYYSSDGGSSWTLNPQTIPSPSRLAFVPGRPGRLLAISPFGTSYSDNLGESWQLANFQIGYHNGNIGAAFSPNGDIYQAGIEIIGSGATLPTQGVLVLGRSQDDGSTWERFKPAGAINGRVDRLTLGAGSRIFGYQEAQSLSRQLIKSVDGGASWSIVGRQNYLITALLADPQVVDAVYFGSSDTETDSDLIYRSLDGGATWQGVYSPTSNDQEEVTAMAAAIVGPQTFLFAAVKEGNSGYLLRSGDQGTTWQRIAAPAFGEIVFDGATGSLFASDAEAYLYGSEDLGLNWSSISGMRGPVAAGGGRLWGRGVSQNLVVSLDRGVTKQPAVLPADESPLVLRSSSQWPYPVFALLPSGKTFSSHSDGLSWLDMTPRNPAPPIFPAAKALELDPLDPRVVFLSGDAGLVHGRFDGHGLALGRAERRFQVEVDWQDFQGQRGRGFASTLTEDTGHFWFFSGNNVELVVKILDGRHINDQYWVFFASMTNVEFNLKITDLETGAVKRYHNPLGTFASQGDTAAFPALAAQQIATREPASSPTGLAAGNPSIILNNRFEVIINWKDFAGQQGQGLGQKLTPDSGSFYFFSESNVEVFVKVLDGRHINGHFWVFVAGLSNVEFTVSVRDLSTTSARYYGNPSGQFASISDTSAF